MEQNFVTLVNRSSQDLTGRYDGKQHNLPPHSRTSWPEVIALKFKEQNPIMGSQNYYTGDKQYLLGIEEYGDPIDPIEQSNSPTLWDLSQIPQLPDHKLQVVKGHGFNPYADRQPGLPASDPGFTPNNDISGSAKADRVVIETPAGPPSPPTFEKP